MAPTPPGPVRTHLEQAGTLQLAHDDPHLLLLGDGRAMVVGTGTDDSMRGAVAPRQRSRLVEVWDPADGEWRKAEPLVKARSGCAAVTLADGRVLVVGGMSREAKLYSSAYLFDPAYGPRTKAGRLRTARHSLTASLLADGRVLVAGGRYSAGADDYEREGAAGATLAAYRVPAADGTPGAPPVDDFDPGPLGHPLATAELYDPRTDTWTVTGATRYARVGAQAVTLVMAACLSGAA